MEDNRTTLDKEKHERLSHLVSVAIVLRLFPTATVSGTLARKANRWPGTHLWPSPFHLLPAHSCHCVAVDAVVFRGGTPTVLGM